MWTPPESCVQFVSAWIAADSQGVLVVLHYGNGSDHGEIFSGAILRPDGSVRTVLPMLHATGSSAYVDAVITASQEVILSRYFVEPNAVWSISPKGAQTWTSDAGAGTLVLTDDGEVVTASGTGLAALDVNSGLVLWTTDAGFLFETPLLSPTASLIGLDPSESEYGYPIAVFAGKHRPSSTAPWSNQGGDNSNRSLSH
jgi:hypothetical protein